MTECDNTDEGNRQTERQQVELNTLYTQASPTKEKTLCRPTVAERSKASILDRG